MSMTNGQMRPLARCLRAVQAVALGCAAFFSTPNSALASDYYCEGIVEWFIVRYDGMLMVKLNSVRQSAEDTTYSAGASSILYPALCDLDSTVSQSNPSTAAWPGTYSISPAVCDGILKAVTAAKLSGKPIRIKYNLNATGQACSTTTIPNYSGPVPMYVKTM